MCIVTYVPLKKGFVFTSNRDENHQRLTLSPTKYIHDTDTLIYPKDLEKGGTWFAINSSKKKLACILNAMAKKPKKEYPISRGQLLLESIVRNDLELNTKQLDQIAPCVLLTYSFEKQPVFKEYSWNGTVLEINNLDISQPKIWCSNTLYSKVESEKIHGIFKENLNPLTTKNSILEFHKSVSQPINSPIFLIKNSGIKTVSRISYHYGSTEDELNYKDFNNDKVTLLKTL
jgi:hypothetical protein